MTSRYDLDQAAVDWARSHVERIRDKWRAWELKAHNEGDHERMMRARRVANILTMELIGGVGCTITPFDVRGPEFRKMLGDEIVGGD